MMVEFTALTEIASSKTFGAALTLAVFPLAERFHRRRPSPLTHSC